MAKTYTYLSSHAHISATRNRGSVVFWTLCWWFGSFIFMQLFATARFEISVSIGCLATSFYLFFAVWFVLALLELWLDFMLSSSKSVFSQKPSSPIRLIVIEPRSTYLQARRLDDVTPFWHCGYLIILAKRSFSTWPAVPLSKCRIFQNDECVLILLWMSSIFFGGFG